MANIHLLLNGEQKGPYQPNEVRELLAKGLATPETLAWHEGLIEWTPVAKVMAAFPTPDAGVPPPVATVATSSTPKKEKKSGCVLASIIAACVAGACLLIVPCLAGIALGPITQGIKQAKESASMQQARAIGLAMFSYANDNGGAYPTGKTSTEVFQKLIDGNYVSDPALFFVSMPGKVRPMGKTLRADNVSFDVTADVTDKSPETLPVAFLTGYTVDYTTGGAATPKPGTEIPFPGVAPKSGGIAVIYRSNKTVFLSCAAGGVIPNFVPADFDAVGITYHQLTP